MKKLLIPLLALSLAGCNNQSLWDNPFAAPKIIAPGITVHQKGYEVLVGDAVPNPDETKSKTVLFTFYVSKVPINPSPGMTCIIKGSDGSLLGGASVDLRPNSGALSPIHVTRVEKNSKIECNIS